MAVAYDAVSTKYNVTSYLPGTSWTHTPVSVENGLVVVSLCLYGTLATGVGCTYGGITMTSAGSVNNGGTRQIYVFYLVGPPSGVQTVAASWTNNNYVYASCISFTGVHQTTPIGTFVSATGNSNAPSVNATSAVDDMVVDVLASGYSTGNGAPWVPAVGAGQTKRWQLTLGFSWSGQGSTEPGAATVTMSWTQGGTSLWAIAALPIKQVAAPGRTNRVWIIGGDE